MYLDAGLGQVFKQRSKYKAARLSSVTTSWDLEVPFRKDFQDFRQELSKAIGRLVTSPSDKTESEQLLLKTKSMAAELKSLHYGLQKRKPRKLKELDAVRLWVDLTFWKIDQTDLWKIAVREF